MSVKSYFTPRKKKLILILKNKKNNIHKLKKPQNYFYSLIKFIYKIINI